MHRIARATPLQPCRLHLVFATGEERIVDLSDIAGRGGVFGVLANAESFLRVSIGEGGRYLKWEGGLDVCADALWQRSAEEVAAIGA